MLQNPSWNVPANWSKYRLRVTCGTQTASAAKKYYFSLEIMHFRIPRVLWGWDKLEEGFTINSKIYCQGHYQAWIRCFLFVTCKQCVRLAECSSPNVFSSHEFFIFYLETCLGYYIVFVWIYYFYWGPELPLTSESLNRQYISHCKAITFVDTSTKDDLKKEVDLTIGTREPLKAADATQTLPEAQRRGSLGVSMTITWSAHRVYIIGIQSRTGSRWISVWFCRTWYEVG